MSTVLEFLKRNLNRAPGDVSSPRTKQERELLKRRWKNKLPQEILREEFELWLDSGEETANIELERIDAENLLMYLKLGEEGTFTIAYPPDYPFGKDSFIISSKSPNLEKWVSEMGSVMKENETVFMLPTSPPYSPQISRSPLHSPMTTHSPKFLHPQPDGFSPKASPKLLHSPKPESSPKWLRSPKAISSPTSSPKNSPKGAEAPLFLFRLLSVMAEKFLETVISDDPRSEDEFEKGAADDFDLKSDEFRHSLDILAKKKRWQRKELQIREEIKRGDQSKARKKSYTQIEQTSHKPVETIFTSNAASGVLMNDLLNIMENHRELGFSADAIQDNIYKWSVRLNQFPPESSIAKQLKQIKQLFGYEYVELEVSFTMDLYPFYPPLVKLIRPRFHGFMMGRVTCMEILRLSHWDPVKDMKYTLTKVREMIGEIGELDVENMANDIAKNPEGAYSELEYLLLRLELLTEQQSRASVQSERIKTLKAQLEKENQKDKEPKEPKKRIPERDSENLYWAKGTGYGYSSHSQPEWDVQAYLAAQREKDSQTEQVLQGISDYLKKGGTPNQYTVLEESCLLPVLESYLRNDSLLDMGRHTSLYLQILGVVKSILNHHHFIPLLDKLEHQTKSIFELLKVGMKQSSIFIKKITNDDSAEYELATETINTFHLVEKALEQYRKSSLKPSKSLDIKEVIVDVTPIEENVNTQKQDMDLQMDNTEPMDEEKKEPNIINTSLEENNKEKQEQNDTTMIQEAQVDSKQEQSKDITEEYMTILGDLQFDTFDMKENGHYVHHYSTNAEVNSSRERILRIAQEQGSLACSLPLNLSSSIFVRVDEERMDLMQALITGPCDTPYDSGCFQFDIFFPELYPSGPPLVNLQTTGGGSVRFNPNLYNCGKVCLSLLGTWSGAEGENWNKDTSTVLQVLISIQSLILVPQPYFNEPGYERNMGTKLGEDASRTYNETIRLGTVEWAMLGQLRNPSPGFVDVIKKHFYLKQHKIVKQIEQWVEESSNASASYSSRLKRAFEDLKLEFQKLQPPS